MALVTRLTMNEVQNLITAVNESNTPTTDSVGRSFDPRYGMIGRALLEEKYHELRELRDHYLAANLTEASKDYAYGMERIVRELGYTPII